MGRLGRDGPAQHGPHFRPISRCDLTRPVDAPSLPCRRADHCNGARRSSSTAGSKPTTSTICSPHCSSTSAAGCSAGDLTAPSSRWTRPCSNDPSAGCSTDSPGECCDLTPWSRQRHEPSRRRPGSIRGRRRRLHDHARQPRAPQRVEPRDGAAVLRARSTAPPQTTGSERSCSPAPARSFCPGLDSQRLEQAAGPVGSAPRRTALAALRRSRSPSR